MEKLNLCKILKGHEGETFWSDVFGYIILKEIIHEILVIQWGNITLNLYSDGSKVYGERCVIFPSKERRDWNKWLEEQKSGVPKTWNELVASKKYKRIVNKIGILHSYMDVTPIEKSVKAFLKIHQLIEAGYGGNITSEEWDNDNIEKWYFTVYNRYNSIFIPIRSQCYSEKHFIAFHTKQQAEEFISYLENIQLLEDYFMI